MSPLPYVMQIAEQLFLLPDQLDTSNLHEDSPASASPTHSKAHHPHTENDDAAALHQVCVCVCVFVFVTN